MQFLGDTTVSYGGASEAQVAAQAADSEAAAARQSVWEARTACVVANAPLGDVSARLTAVGARLDQVVLSSPAASSEVDRQALALASARAAFARATAQQAAARRAVEDVERRIAGLVHGSASSFDFSMCSASDTSGGETIGRSSMDDLGSSSGSLDDGVQGRGSDRDQPQVAVSGIDRASVARSDANSDNARR